VSPSADAAVVPIAGAARAAALKFVVLIGVVSLFADMTYEAARSITGPFLGLLGASGAAVGVIAGGGELIGYALRLWSGRLADRTQRYWLITISGYAVNLLAVPLLALAGHWVAAAVLIVLERAGKAVRTPARDVMLSFAARQTGRGWGFGLHEALDQTGATLGPLIVAAVLYFTADYRMSFAVLLAPALCSLSVLFAARRLYPHPRELEPAGQPQVAAQGFPRSFWLYLAGACLVAAGYADYPLIAYHFQRAGSVPQEWIAVFYAIAMAVDGLAALALGRWYDRHGTLALIGATACSALFALFAFTGGFGSALAGVVLWGIGMGAQESIMRAAIAELTPVERRGAAFGLFNMAFGVVWFAGSAALGWLYDASINALIAVAMGLQVVALGAFGATHLMRVRERSSDRGAA
jgi:MFS family permease